MNVACFVQSCLTDADFVLFSNYCLIGTRQKLRFFSLCVLQVPDPCRAGCRHPVPSTAAPSRQGPRGPGAAEIPSVSAVGGDVGIAPYEDLSANRACTAARAKLSLRDKRTRWSWQSVPPSPCRGGCPCPPVLNLPRTFSGVKIRPPGMPDRPD